MLANIRLALQRMTHLLWDATASCTAALSRPVQRPTSTARYARLGLERLTERIVPAAWYWAAPGVVGNAATAGTWINSNGDFNTNAGVRDIVAGDDFTFQGGAGRRGQDSFKR